MVGLIYKDYITIKGKKLLCMAIVIFLSMAVLRVVFPGSRELEDFMVTNDKGETINMLDTFFLIFEGMYIIIIMTIVNRWILSIARSDDKNKLCNYLSVMPYNKRTYVASKYLFALIAAAVMFGLVFLLHNIIKAFMGEGMNKAFSEMIGAMILPAITFIIFFAALDLPMNLLLGREKAQLISVCIVMLIAFLVIGFILFGDLTVFSKINMDELLIWWFKNAKKVKLVIKIAPLVMLAFYALSYFISSRIYERMEQG